MMLFILAFIYFIPFLLANHFGNKDQLMIFLINLLIGWTVIGWIVAFIWAFRK